jgi:protein involved in polysaccharide export with SLBB domain
MPFIKHIYFLIFLILTSPAFTQTIDPETLKGLLDAQSEGRSAQGDSYRSFTQNSYSGTLNLLKELDVAQERELFYQSLMEERIDLVSKLCAKDSRACYLIDEYRDQKYLEVPINIEDLMLFGLDAFTGYPLNLDSFNELPISSNYRIKVGDEINLIISGINPFNDRVVVDPMGEISIPDYGIIRTSGLTVTEAKAAILDKVISSYPGSTVQLSLVQMKPKKIFVLGNVINPGSYGVNAFATAINALITSGGLEANSSLRNIVVNSSTQQQKFIDLYDFLIDGKTDSDVILSDGDTVLVKGIESSVTIFGEVIRPAIYEIKPGETIQDVLNFALGYTDIADKQNITLHRRNSLGQVSTFQIKKPNLSNFEIEGGDKLIVNPMAGENLNDVSIFGAIRNPGSFGFENGATLSSYINFENDLLDHTYTLMGTIKRFNKEIRAWTFIPFDLLDKDLSSKIKIQPRDIIYIFSREDIEFLNSTSTFNFLGLKAQSTASPLNNASSQASSFQVMQPDQQMQIEESKIGNGGSILSKTLPECFSSYRLDNSFVEMINLKLSAFNISTSSSSLNMDNLLSCPEIFLKDPELLPYILIQAIPVIGNIRLPALYPVAKNVSPMQVFYFAGGSIDGDDVSNSFDVLHKQNSVSLNLEELNSIKDIKFLNVRQLGYLTKQGFVTLYGEVRFPGKYSLAPGETLSSIYKRAGGLTSLSYPLGGILTRESIKAVEQKVLAKAQKDLGEVLTSAAMNGYLNQNPTNLVQLITLISSLSESDGLGRIVAELDPNKIQRDIALDVMLENGDKIYIPKINSTITIVGNVLNPITVPYNNKFSAKDYIKLAGGYKKSADKSSAYIVYPNGVSQKIQGRLFSFSSTDNPVPGSTIIIPRSATNLDTMGLLKFATPILADLSVTAASISAITNN